MAEIAAVPPLDPSVDRVVGRRDELDALERVLDAFDRGRPGALALVGEPGIGKTRLLAELGSRAECGGIGLTLLLLLWFVGCIPLAIVWFVSRPRENVTVFGPAGQQVMVSEDEARKRVEQPGWTYQKPIPGQSAGR